VWRSKEGGEGGGRRGSGGCEQRVPKARRDARWALKRKDSFSTESKEQCWTRRAKTQVSVSGLWAPLGPGQSSRAEAKATEGQLPPCSLLLDSGSLTGFTKGACHLAN